ncbi:MAG: geranylgeranylglyceryl/heptaprenylglyceryl phosphate synthase [Bacteroidota bacterium]
MISSNNRKKLAVLIDPDKTSKEQLQIVFEIYIRAKVDVFLVGSSLLLRNSVCEVVEFLKQNTTIPVYLFPGNIMQVCSKADGILLLSLISGRNPELLIGQQVLAAPSIKAANFDVIPTGYMLIDSGKTTSVEYMSNTKPIPSDKPDIAVCTAMAGEQLGMKAVYLEAGSGAKKPVPAELIAAVRDSIEVEIWVGGGIKTPQAAIEACNAGADVIVIGTAFEQSPELIEKIATAIHQ